MRFLGIIFFILATTFQAVCQPNQQAADWIEALRALPKNDLKRVPLLLELSSHYRSSEPSKSLSYAKEAQTITQNSAKDTLKVQVFNSIGVAHEYLKEYDSALWNYQKALTLSEVNNYHIGIVQANGNIAICYELLNKLDSAAILYQKSSSLSQAYKFPSEAADNLANLAGLLSKRGNYSEALTYFREAIQFYSTLGDSANLADMHNGIGEVYLHKAQYPTALEYYLKALKIAQEIRDDLMKSRSYKSLGSLYYKQGDWKKSLKNFQDALQLLEKHSPYRLQKAEVYGDIGSVLIEMNQYDKAISMMEKGLKISEEFGLAKISSDILFYMGIAHFKRADFIAAKNFYEQSFKLKTKIQDNYGLIDVKLNLGELAYEEGNLPRAIREMEDALNTASALEAKDGMKKAAHRLSDVYKQKSDFEKAYEYQSMVIKIDEEVFSLEKSKAIAEVELNHQIKMKEKDLEEAQKKAEIIADKSRFQTLLIWATGGICVLFVLGFLLVIKHNRKQRAAQTELQRKNSEIKTKNEEIAHQKQMLEDRYEELKALDDEKNYLIGVVAHDLKSPLNQISGFLTILKYEKEKLPDSVMKTHQMIGQTVKNMSQMISKILDLKAIESKTLNMQLEPTHVNTIVQEIVESYKMMAQRKNISLTFNKKANKDLLNIDQKLLEQILENLVSNAIKFSPKGKEVIICSETKDDFFRINVKDQGPGIQEEEREKLFQKFQKLSAKPTAKESSTGLGLSIVKKYTEAMQGKVWYEDGNPEGAIFITEFPLYKN